MRIARLIEELGLLPHPEGGHFAENHRSPQRVQVGQQQRSAGTHIHYLLQAGEISRWHRIDADEIWHLYEGGPLVLHLLAADFSSYRTERLAAGEKYMAAVPAGSWQAASCGGEYALVGCTVFPGFEFGQFVLLRQLEKEKRVAMERFPEGAGLL